MAAGTIDYFYDAAGNKLSKEVTENSSGVPHPKITDYIGSMVYQDSVLQFISDEEGRIRYRPAVDSTSTPASFVCDYFIKDHLGNIRMVLTDELQTDVYPAATMETANAANEDALYSKIEETRTDITSSVPGYPTDNYITPNNSVARVSCSVGGSKIGPGITLRVMSGDNFSIRVSSWYKTNGVSPTPPAPNPLPDLIAALASGIGGLPNAHGATADLQDGTLLTPGLNSSSSPNVYTHIKANLPVTNNGYLYIYVSNETPNIDVFFDNLQVTHTRGPLLEETHYYPWGLIMAGISSTALKSNYVQNKYAYNGKEFQSKEFSNGEGLKEYDFGTRLQDPQIGRWWTLDSKADLLEMSSPYVYCYNSPLIYKDPDGELAILINGRVGSDQERPVNGQQGKKAYWDQGIIDAIKSSGIPNCGTDNKLFFVDGDQFFGSTVIPFEPLDFKVRNGDFFAGNDPDSRAGAGSLEAYYDWNTIKSKLARDPKTNKIIEKIEIYTHSRGAAFGAGYIETLLRLIAADASDFADPRNEIDLVYNMGDHQSWGINEPGNLNAYSHDHCNDPLSGNKMNGLKGAFTSDETSPGALGAHSTASFVNDLKAFTKAFAASRGHSQELLIQKFVDDMQLIYGVTVKTKKE